MGTVKRPLLASAGRGFFYWGGFFLTSFLSSLRRACLSLPYVRLCEDEARGRSNPDKNKHSCPSLRGGTTKQSRKKQHTKLQSTLPSPHFLVAALRSRRRKLFLFIHFTLPFVFAPCLSVFALCPSLRGRGTRTKQSRQKQTFSGRSRFVTGFICLVFFKPSSKKHHAFKKDFRRK
jgi:hypothetical protein